MILLYAEIKRQTREPSAHDYFREKTSCFETM